MVASEGDGIFNSDRKGIFDFVVVVVFVDVVVVVVVVVFVVVVVVDLKVAFKD